MMNDQRIAHQKCKVVTCRGHRIKSKVTWLGHMPKSVANMAETVTKETGGSEQIRKQSKYKCYLNHPSPRSVAPRRSRKSLKRKLAASMCADGQISGNSREAAGEHAPLGC